MSACSVHAAAFAVRGQQFVAFAFLSQDEGPTPSSSDKPTGRADSSEAADRILRAMQRDMRRHRHRQGAEGRWDGGVVQHAGDAYGPGGGSQAPSLTSLLPWWAWLIMGLHLAYRLWKVPNLMHADIADLNDCSNSCQCSLNIKQLARLIGLTRTARCHVDKRVHY
jgi:hypothetical protein